MKTLIFKCSNWWSVRYDGRKKVFKGVSKEAFKKAVDKHYLRMSNNITFSEWSTRREILSYFSTIPYRIAENEPNDYDKYQRPSRNGIGYVAICPGERGNNFYTDDTITVAYLKKKYEKFLKNSHI